MECVFCGCKPCKCESSSIFNNKEETKTVLDKVFPKDQSDKTLPGAMVMFTTSGSSGTHTNSFGNGAVDLYLHKPGQLPPWVNLGDIYFSSPTAEQLEDMQTSPMHSEGYKEYCTHKRRLSKKQAEYIQFKISQFLMSEFKGIIPADDEIDDIRAGMQK